MATSNRSLPSLPFELVEEILYRTPAKSLLRFKSTSKQWYALITDKNFIYKHLHHSPERFFRIYDTVQIMDPVTGTRSESEIPYQFPYPFSFTTMVHCDGLMLCKFHTRACTDVAIWNPVLRKFKWIRRSQNFTNSDYFGIGYANTSRDNYKILRFTDQNREDQDVEIYEFRTDSWKAVDAKMDWFIDVTCKGLSVKGNMYWIVKGGEHFILSFDFSEETFKNVCDCPPSSFSSLGCLHGDRLCFLEQDEETMEIQVWLTESLGDGNVSFSKYFKVAGPNLPVFLFHTYVARPVYSIGKHKSIMAWCESFVEEEDDDRIYIITLYEIDEGGIRKQIETERHEGFLYRGSFICGYVYFPSLVPLPI